MRKLSVLTVPAFKDNYLWIIHDGLNAVVVDPGDATVIRSALTAHQLTLVAILLTHHHHDHVGGVSELVKDHSVPVFGPSEETIVGVSHTLTDASIITISELALHFRVISVPGHTKGHIAYHAPDQDWLFCGDTLFAGGCGRLFEGSPQQMATSLSKLAALPDKTQVYCAHEYTLSNLSFALVIEQDNRDLIHRISREQMKRDCGQYTVPSTIAIEKKTNPFLRCSETSVIESLRLANRLQGTDPVSVFAALREWKNNF
jgi:hydroxyacylglutathione hydrolase